MYIPHDIAGQVKNIQTTDGHNYKLVTLGKKRYYVESLNEKTFDLEHTTPFRLYYNHDVIEENSWGNFLCKIVNLLASQSPIDRDTLLSFRVSWSQTSIFSSNPKTNSKLLDNGLYINCNHTAQHSCWLVKDLLALWNVDISRALLLIHRPSAAEHPEIRNLIKNQVCFDFDNWLQTKHNKSPESFAQTLAYFEKVHNPTLRKISNSYIDFFLFDEHTSAYNYAKSVEKHIRARVSKVSTQEVLIDSLELLLKYYKEMKY